MASRIIVTWCQICLTIFTVIINLRESSGVPNNADTLKTRQISPKLFNIEENVSDRRFSLNSGSEINDTENNTLQTLIDVPIDSESLATRQNSPTFFNIEMKANNRRLSLGVASNKNDDLRKRLLDLNMWFPCGTVDRCRVGRNYCNVDTNRCEICNSDVCHGSNADSMCNFMCKEIPSPEESSTASSGTTPPVTITTERCPNVSPSELTTNDCPWKKVSVVVIICLALTWTTLSLLVVKKRYGRKKSADITRADQATSLKELATTDRGYPVMMRQDSTDAERAVSNSPVP
ncbi:uncharacterized protein LOC110448630 [Mizuhopecten yessoensis]|uniref:TNFR-Cys domain-containing protein n=1 Tax=Mizuhopecten yessoensis TaxID=6573 RepID=A0A210QSP5_MIZYE|nr:uncharacterized protein LOC110448630 [Mizuhopecten yessoensis]OWF51787.1 hypothetical protein KP79_PYT05598 [Mizuhopecten yessoensis]